MGFGSISNLITTEVAAVATAQSYSVIYENDPTAQPAVPWTKCIIQFGSKEQVEMPLLKRTVGLLEFQIRTKYGVGTSEALGIADIWANAFTNTTLGTNVKFRVPRTVKVGKVDDNYQVNVLCPFHADEN
jgi:hypothetical protein